MSIPTEYHEQNYPIPETREREWDPTVTALLTGFAGDLDTLCSLLGTIPILTLGRSSGSYEDGGTITATNQWMVVMGTPGSITLDTIVSITPGEVAGQLLILSGTSDTNTVTIIDGSGVSLNGDAILGEIDCLALVWDATAETWVEIWRNS